jgi:hypothetical protein
MYLVEAKSRLHSRASLAVIALALVFGCSSDDPPSPDSPGSERPPAELTVARLATTAPPLEASTVSFWAIKGESAEQKLYFLDDRGQRGEEYLSLKLENESLQLRPDGSAIAEGDSVLITITVEDPALLLFELQPTGLKFSASKPAELKIRYAHADDDLNEDGEVDGEDNHLETILGIWRQEQPGDPFVRLGSVKVEDQEELEAELTGFSRYAIAY